MGTPYDCAQTQDNGAMPFLPCKKLHNGKIRLISGKPDTSRGVRPVWRECLKPTAAMRQGAGRLPYCTRLSRPSPCPRSPGNPPAMWGKTSCVPMRECVSKGPSSRWPVSSSRLWRPAHLRLIPTFRQLPPYGATWASLIFNLLVLVGAVRMSDRIVKELLGL